MIRLAATNSPADAAWAAFDAAALHLNRLYRVADPTNESPADRERRMQLSIEVLRLWDAWRSLFLGDGPGEAA